MGKLYVENGFRFCFGMYESCILENFCLFILFFMNFFEVRLFRFFFSFYYLKKVEESGRKWKINLGKFFFLFYILYCCFYGCLLDILFVSLV